LNIHYKDPPTNRLTLVYFNLFILKLIKMFPIKVYSIASQFVFKFFNSIRPLLPF